MAGGAHGSELATVDRYAVDRDWEAVPAHHAERREQTSGLAEFGRAAKGLDPSAVAGCNSDRATVDGLQCDHGYEIVYRGHDYVIVDHGHDLARSETSRVYGCGCAIGYRGHDLACVETACECGCAIVYRDRSSAEATRELGCVVSPSQMGIWLFS